MQVENMTSGEYSSKKKTKSYSLKLEDMDKKHT